MALTTTLELSAASARFVRNSNAVPTASFRGRVARQANHPAAALDKRAGQQHCPCRPRLQACSFLALVPKAGLPGLGSSIPQASSAILWARRPFAAGAAAEAGEATGHLGGSRRISDWPHSIVVCRQRLQRSSSSRSSSTRAWQQDLREARMAAAAAVGGGGGAAGNVFALDFDGVMCDSCGESSISAVKAARVQWPHLFHDLTPDEEAQILKQMRLVRPVVETGYDNVLLVRLLHEMNASAHGTANAASKVAEGLTIDVLLQRWEADIKPRAMAEWQVTKEPLVELFGRVRDDWIATDLPSWIAANAFYPGTADALRSASSPVYIVTTKQTRFVVALLRQLAGVDSFPEEHIFGLGSGPKVDVLQQLQARPEHAGSSLHFVEDRLATLRNVIKTTPALDAWNLYLGDWGYNTQDEREAARQVHRINVIDLPAFCGLLK